MLTRSPHSWKRAPARIRARGMTTLADKLRERTVARGCTPAEAAAAADMLAALPPERLNAEAPEPKSWAQLGDDFEDFIENQFAETDAERAERYARREAAAAASGAMPNAP